MIHRFSCAGTLFIDCHRKPDISIALESLSWYPRVPLNKGLTATIEYFRNIMNIVEWDFREPLVSSL